MSMPATTALAKATPQQPRLLDQVRQTAFARFDRPEPGERYADWVRRYVLFHGKRHPRDLGAAEVGRFLEHLAHSDKDPLRSLEQAREALTFLYQDVLRVELGKAAGLAATAARARPARRPGTRRLAGCPGVFLLKSRGA